MPHLGKIGRTEEGEMECMETLYFLIRHFINLKLVFKKKLTLTTKTGLRV